MLPLSLILLLLLFCQGRKVLSSRPLQGGTVIPHACRLSLAIGAGTQLKALHVAEPRPHRGQRPPWHRHRRTRSEAEGSPLESTGRTWQSLATLPRMVSLLWDAAACVPRGFLKVRVAPCHTPSPSLSGSRFKRISAHLLSFPRKQDLCGRFLQSSSSLPKSYLLGARNETKQSVSWLLKPGKGTPLTF